MPRLESRVFLDIEADFGFLRAVKVEDVVCRFPACGKQADKLQRHEHISSRDAVLHQDPRHEDYLSIFKRWITLSFCHRHQKQFHAQHDKPTQADVTKQMHHNIEVIINQLRRYYLADCRLRRAVPGSWPGTIDVIHPDNLTTKETQKVMESYKKRFDPSCTSIPPNNRPRKPPCSFRASVTNSLSTTEHNAGKTGFIYIVYSKRSERQKEDKEQIVKIGYSNAKPGDRIQACGEDCNLLALENTTWKGYEVFSVRYANRVENLIHTELRHYGHNIQHRCAGHGPRLRKHGEWFQVSLSIAIATIKHWIAWIEHVNHKPYDEDGNFCAWTSLCSPNLSRQHVENEFLLDSRGNRWYTHRSENAPIEAYKSCEMWQDCRCSEPKIRTLIRTSSRADTSEGNDHTLDAEDGSNLSSAAHGDSFIHIHSAESPEAPLSNSRNTSVQKQCATPQSRRLSHPESPPSLIASSLCSTPLEATVATPRLDGTVSVGDRSSQDSFESALSHYDFCDLTRQDMPTPPLSISDSEDIIRVPLMTFDRCPLALKQGKLASPIRRRKSSQTTLDRYLGSPATHESRRRSTGNSTADRGKACSKAVRTDISLGI